MLNTRRQVAATVDFCNELIMSNLYCKHQKVQNPSLSCLPPSNKKIKPQLPECWTDKDCPKARLERMRGDQLLAPATGRCALVS